MNASRARRSRAARRATSMNGRRRPSGVWKPSLHGPITSGRVSANTPSAARTSAISVVESGEALEHRRQVGGGRRQRPREPERPDAEDDDRACAAARQAATGAGGETAADDLDHGALGTRDLLLAVGELAQHPAREQLLQGAVEDPAREPRVEVGAERAFGLTLLDHALDGGESLAHLVDLPLQVRAAGDLAHHHGHERGSFRQVRSRILAMPRSFSSAGSSDASTAWKRSSSSPQFSRKTVSSTSSLEEK